MLTAGHNGPYLSCRIAKEKTAEAEGFAAKNPALVTGFFFFAW